MGGALEHHPAPRHHTSNRIFAGNLVARGELTLGRRHQIPFGRDRAEERKVLGLMLHIREAHSCTLIITQKIDFELTAIA